VCGNLVEAGVNRGERDRAAGIVIRDGRIALIRREHSDRGKLYFLYPGGGVESGESLEQAVEREVYEELGLVATPVRLVAIVSRYGNQQYHYVMSVSGGEFGTGAGPEMTGEYHPSRGTYTPVWMQISDLDVNPVYPRCVSELVATAAHDGWPAEPLRFIDDEET
jgi:ADP-ribose pyrophosphatase YjhB (NUDIX family)